MNKQQNSPTIIALTVAAVVGRFFPHPPNMTPLGATSLFSGAKLERPWNYLVPLFILFLTDLFLGFHSTMIYVYVSFAVGIFLSEKYLKNNFSLLRIGTLSVINPTIFFIVTNFGVWLSGNIYPKTVVGLSQSYLMGLPFYKNMLIGDITFGLGFFALYYLVAKSNVDKVVDRWALSGINKLKRI